MRRFAKAATLAVLLGLGTASTVSAHPGPRFFSPVQRFGAVQVFPSFNSSPFRFHHPFVVAPRPFVANRFVVPNSFNNGFVVPNSFNNGFMMPTLFPTTRGTFNFYGRRW